MLDLNLAEWLSVQRELQLQASVHAAADARLVAPAKPKLLSPKPAAQSTRGGTQARRPASSAPIATGVGPASGPSSDGGLGSDVLQPTDQPPLHDLMPASAPVKKRGPPVQTVGPRAAFTQGLSGRRMAPSMSVNQSSTFSSTKLARSPPSPRRVRLAMNSIDTRTHAAVGTVIYVARPPPQATVRTAPRLEQRAAPSDTGSAASARVASPAVGNGMRPAGGGVYHGHPERRHPLHDVW